MESLPIDFSLIHPQAGIDDIAENMPDIFTSDEVERGAGSISSTMLYNNTPMLDQGNTNECGCFGISKAINELKWLDGSYPTVTADPTVLRPIDVEKYGANPKTGSSMTGNLNLMKDQTLISGWYKCSNEDAIKQALISGCTVYTGSMHIDRNACLMTYDVVFSNIVPFAHLFCVIGYDETGFIAANSWGTRVNKQGLFHIPYGSRSKMYSAIAIIDQKNSHIITQIASDRQNMQESRTKSIWNGMRGDEAIIGAELAIVLTRLGEHYSAPLNTATYSRKNIVGIISKVFNVPQSILRNQSNPEGNCTRYQAVLMCMRASSVG